MALQSDGRIIVAGFVRSTREFAVVRLTPDGALDPSFGNGGVAEVDFFPSSGTQENVWDVAVAPDDSIMVVGQVNIPEAAAVVRLTANGQPHPSLAAGSPAGGLVLSPAFDQSRVASPISPRCASPPTGPRSWEAGPLFGYTHQYSHSGYTLTAFNAQGVVTGGGMWSGASNVENGTSLWSSTGERTISMAIDGQDRLLVAVDSPPLFGGRGWLIGRHLPTGALDPSFGNQGRIAFCRGNDPSYCVPDSMTLGPDGSIIVLGHTRDGYGVARFDANGTLDTTFGQNGLAPVLVGDTGYAATLDVLVQPDKKVIVAGNWPNPNVRRLTATGEPDKSFGVDGVVVTAETHAAGTLRSTSRADCCKREEPGEAEAEAEAEATSSSAGCSSSRVKR